MKRIGIIPNTDRDTNLAKTIQLIDLIYENDSIPCVEKIIYDKLSLIPVYRIKNNRAVLEADIYKNSDFLIVLGGDGTMLHAAGFSCIYDTPIFGVNLGNLGYLTDCESDNMESSIKRIFAGNYKSEKRMMLKTCLNGQVMHRTALNDICISKASMLKLIGFDLHINNEYIDTYRADGILISTPTGSTAYNLSAGGPILKPDSEMITITPICPHTLYARPFVVSHNDEIKVIINGSYGGGLLSADGQAIQALNETSEIVIKKSNYQTTILKTKELGFYDTLRLKMVGELKR